jgi:hypothetical protein
MAIYDTGHFVIPGITYLGTATGGIGNCAGVASGYPGGIAFCSGYAVAGETDAMVNSTGIKFYSVSSGVPSTNPVFQVDGSGNTIVGANLQANGHLLVQQTTQPGIAQTGGSGTPTLSITATDVSGTVIEATSATGFVLTFHTPWGVAPDCVVTSPTGTALTSYTPTTTTLTVVNPTATAARFSYSCMQ